MRHANNKEYLDRYRRDPNCFGGALLRGNPKGRRPYSHAQALHVTMRSSLAKGRRSLLEPGHKQRVKQILRKQAWKFGITVYSFANSGNHLHLLIRPPRKRVQFAGFIRALTGLIARVSTGAERGKARGLKFWDKRPFSRVVAWGKPFQVCRRYVLKNLLEAVDLVETAQIETEVKKWRTEAPS
jgi:REP element-mobilizing transposase RayT